MFAGPPAPCPRVPVTTAGNIAVKSPRDLSAGERAAWGGAVDAAAVPTPYLSPEFADLVEDLRGGVRVALLYRRGETTPAGFFPFQTDGGRAGRPVAGRLNDFHGLLAPDDLLVDPARLLKACGLRVWRFDHLLPHPALGAFVERTAPSPYMDLSEGFDAYYKARRAAGSRKVKQIQRMGRKFHREDGPVRFDPDVKDPAILAKLIRWKRAQYAATGVFDLFRLGWPRDLLARLLETNSPRLTGRMGVLYSRDRPVAADLGMQCGSVLHSWFAAYDDAFASHSPGHVCSMRGAERAAEYGMTRIELGKGPEDYKRSLASDAVPVGEGSVDLRAVAPLARGARQAYRAAKAAAAAGPAAAPLRRLVRQVKGSASGAAGF